MAHLLLEPIDWGSLLKHEGRVCMPRLHEGSQRMPSGRYLPTGGLSIDPL
jgi:hypothetical protein